MFKYIVNLLFTNTTITKLLNTINTKVLRKKRERPLFFVDLADFVRNTVSLSLLFIIKTFKWFPIFKV